MRNRTLLFTAMSTLLLGTIGRPVWAQDTAYCTGTLGSGMQWFVDAGWPFVDEQNLGAAGLDVFEFEPDVPAALLKFPNVTLLPHIGSATGEGRQDMAKSVFINIDTFLKTGHVVNPVN